MAEQIVKLLTVRLVAFTKYTLEHAELESCAGRTRGRRGLFPLASGSVLLPIVRIAFT